MQSFSLSNFVYQRSFPFYIHTCTHAKDFRVHIHQDFDELVIVLSGSAMHVVNDEHFFIKKGDVFVISGNTSHGYSNTYDFKICNIMYRPAEEFNGLHDIRQIAGFHALFFLEPYLATEKHFSSFLSLSPTDFLTVNNMINNLMSEFVSMQPGYQDFIRSQFVQMAIFLSRKYNFGVTSENSFLSIASSVSYMENSFTKEIEIPAVAEKSGLSARQFSRLFKETYGTTPVHYILNLRLDYASYLLKNTDHTISEVAFLSGFQDINYFSRAYKKHRNTTPREYRKDNISNANRYFTN